MPQKQVEGLYKFVSGKYNNDFGSLDNFYNNLQDPLKSKSLYDKLSQDQVPNLGDYDSFRLKVSSKASEIDPKSVLIDPDETILEQPQETNLQKLIRGLEEYRDNPKAIMRDASGPNAVEQISNKAKPLPKFIMGIPTTEIPTEKKPTFDGVDTQAASKKTEEERAKFNLPFTPTGKDVAKYEKTQFFKREVAKEKKKGLSDLDAYKKVRGELKLPGEIIDNAFEQSITGSLFRIFGLEQQSDPSFYREILEKDPNLLSASKFEQLAAGGFSLLMPADALLFKGGGKLKNLKSVGRTGDIIANKIARFTKKPLPQVRVHVKNAIERITGGAGGFAAFDSGRSIVDQIESTGKVDALEVVEHGVKGAVTGSFTSGLGLAGSVTGKYTKLPLADRALEFAGEVVGLGTVAPILDGQVGFTEDSPINLSTEEGRKQAYEGYFDAAGTIIGLKLLKTLTPTQAEFMKRTVATEAQRIVQETGKPPSEVLNKIGTELKTSLQLAIEGKTPEKTIRERITEYEIKEVVQDPSKPIKPGLDRAKKVAEEFDAIESKKQTVEQLVKQGFSQSEAEQRANIVLRDAGIKTEVETKPVILERNQLETSISELSKKINELEKAGAEQGILDKLQIEIDGKVVRLNEMGASEIEINTALQTKETPSTKEVQLQMKRRARSEQERLDKTLQERDFFNRKFEPDPLLEVPLHPADAGRKAVSEIQTAEVVKTPKTKPTGPTVKKKKLTGIDNKGSAKDYDIKVGDKIYVNQSGYSGTIKGFKRGKDSNVVTVENERGRQDLTDRNLFTPKKIYEEGINRRNPKSLFGLEGQKKLEGFKLQKELSNLDITLQANEMRLKDKTLTETEVNQLKRSIQRTKELKRDTQETAKVKGIELMAFMGIPTPNMLKQLFGSSKSKPKRYSNQEIDRLYNNALQRLDKDTPKETAKVSTTPNDLPPKFQSPASRALNWVASDMVGRVRSMGTKTSIEASEKMFNAIDLEKKTYGEITGVLDPALKISGSGKDAMNLSRFVEVEMNGKKVLMNRLHLGIEGKIKLSNKELEIAEKIKDVIEKRGSLFEENNIMQEGPDGTIRPFKVIGRNIAPRIMTPEFYDLLNKGKYNQDFKIMINDFATATGQSKEAISNYFSEMSDNVKGVVSPNQSTPTRTTQAEHSRKWKDIPHAIKDSNGKIVPIVEYKPFEYARRLAETGSSRIAVTKFFGQEIDKTSIVNQLKEQIAEEGGNPIVFHQGIRALSGTPVEAPVLSVGTGSRITRAYNGAMSIVRNSTLSGSVFPNISEPLGNVRKHSGMLPLMRNIFNLTTNKKAIEAMLEKQGAITVDIANLSIDPARPVSSFTRATTEIMRRGFGFKQANEFQELLAGFTYSEKVKKFKQGKGSVKDALLIREMGFSREVADLIIKGRAPLEAYDALIRRAPAYLTGGAQRGGEMSRLEHSKYFKALTAFEQYSQMKIRSLANSVKTYGKATNEGINERDYKKIVAANQLMASEILGTAISGATTQLMLAFVYGGADNVGIKINEIKENPWGFALESYAYSAVGGVIGSIMQSTSNGKLSQNPWDVFFPVSVVTELTKAASGTGKYTYLEAEERYLEVAKRYFPINKAVRTMSTAIGFGNEESLKDDNAIKAYYRWKFQNKYGGGYRTGEIDEEIKSFRVNMKKAYTSLRAGEPTTEIDKHLFKALDLSGKDVSSGRMSILGKRLLIQSKIAPGKDLEVFESRKEILRKRIGEEAYERIVRHDERLEDYAEFWKN